jgi:hypothetical protein
VGVGAVGADADVGAVFPGEALAAHGVESHWTMSNSVMEPGGPEAGRRTRPISWKAWARMASILRWATAWLAICSAVSTASNWLTRSAEETISLPRERRNSTVPASTMETYMMAFLGEYCMARRRVPASMVSSVGGQFLPA